MMCDNIRQHRRKAIWVCLGLATVLWLCTAAGSVSYAQGRYVREEWRLPDFYPRGFDGYGKIEKIQNDGVVINDRALKFAPRIKYATPRNPNTGIYAFNVGDTVAYLLNEDQDIVSLWYIEMRRLKRR